MAKAKWKNRSVASATLRGVRISPSKARLVVNLVKGMQVDPALQTLEFSPKKGARLLAQLLRSAVMNAKEQSGADVDSLWISDGWVNMAKPLKRYMPRARGSADMIRKRSSHITVVLGER